jgi:site-specific DNA-methyltransferase (adenine-specific)
MANDNHFDHAPAAVWEPLTALKPWAANPRDNSKAVAEVAKSIRRFGWGAPIVANKRDGEIIAGHTRFAAAERLKLDQVPVRWLDLDPADAHALALADNKVGEVATWDDATLANVLRELREADESLLGDTGFSDEEIANLLGEVTPTVLEPEGEPPELDEQGPVHSVLGEVYQLGPHRLMCGDSTSVDAVERLMAGEKAVCLWTDPPYGVAYVGKTKDALQIENDRLNSDQLTDFLRSAFNCALTATAPGAAWYVAAPAGPLHHCFSTVLLEIGAWRQTLNWIKSSMVLGRSDYHYQHEPIFYGWNPAGPHKWSSDRKQTTVLKFDKPSRNGEHPTMKPVELVEYCIGNNTDAGDLVLDLFGGSGTTLIASAQTKRVARLMELDPRYCDVIRRRWTRWAKANGVDAGSGALDG